MRASTRTTVPCHARRWSATGGSWLGEDAALDAVLEPGFDPRRTAILEAPVDGLAPRPLRAG